MGCVVIKIPRFSRAQSSECPREFDAFSPRWMAVKQPLLPGTRIRHAEVLIVKFHHRAGEVRRVLCEAEGESIRPRLPARDQDNSSGCRGRETRPSSAAKRGRPAMSAIERIPNAGYRIEYSEPATASVTRDVTDPSTKPRSGSRNF